MHALQCPKKVIARWAATPVGKIGCGENALHVLSRGVVGNQAGIHPRPPLAMPERVAALQFVQNQVIPRRRTAARCCPLIVDAGVGIETIAGEVNLTLDLVEFVPGRRVNPALQICQPGVVDPTAIVRRNDPAVMTELPDPIRQVWKGLT
jgi:hypothetical protein